MAWNLFWGYWLITNIRAHWENEIRGTQFKPVVAPGYRTLVIMFLTGIVGAVLTLTTPTPDILWADPYDHPWTTIHKTTATLWIMLSVMSFMFALGKKYVLDEEENRCSVLLLLGLMIYLFQVLLEVQTHIPGVGEEGNGWDHHSLVVDFVHVQMRVITIPFILVIGLEIFLDHKIFVFLRILFSGSITMWFYFLAAQFGTEWCDNLDNPNATHCDLRSQGVAIHVAGYTLPQIIIVSMFFHSLIWFRYIPQRMIIWLLPANQEAAIPPSRIQDPGNTHRRFGGHPTRRPASRVPPPDEMQHYGIDDADDADDVLDFHADSDDPGRPAAIMTTLDDSGSVSL